jgi:hypothetical protein
VGVGVGVKGDGPVASPVKGGEEGGGGHASPFGSAKERASAKLGVRSRLGD